MWLWKYIYFEPNKKLHLHKLALDIRENGISIYYLFTYHTSFQLWLNLNSVFDPNHALKQIAVEDSGGITFKLRWNMHFKYI